MNSDFKGYAILVDTLSHRIRGMLPSSPFTVGGETGTSAAQSILSKPSLPQRMLSLHPLQGRLEQLAACQTHHSQTYSIRED